MKEPLWNNLLLCLFKSIENQPIHLSQALQIIILVRVYQRVLSAQKVKQHVEKTHIVTYFIFLGIILTMNSITSKNMRSDDPVEMQNISDEQHQKEEGILDGDKLSQTVSSGTFLKNMFAFNFFIDPRF
jgi:preprotein translocase subunit SecG